MALATIFMALVPTISAQAASYNGASISPASDGKTYTISAAPGDTLTLINIGSSKSSLSITFKNNVNGSIVITEGSTLPASAPSAPTGKVSSYFDVTLNGLTNADLSGGVWHFSVTKSFLNAQGLGANNVFLQHYGPSWDSLTTKQTTSDVNNYNFDANVTSFSPFAVVAVPGLINTGSPYALGAFIAIGALIVIGGSFMLTRKKKT